MQAFYIPSGSMENTLQLGDRVIVNRLGTITGHGIQRGDVIVFRVIGMPGDHVVCCTAKGNLMVNVHELDETSYIYAGNETLSKHLVLADIWQIRLTGKL